MMLAKRLGTTGAVKWIYDLLELDGDSIPSMYI